mmetsp:Transcript_30669/g.63185  ORF Transcript_30669/g.63185 Transcript_30669/m.63185 type:complete len:126 (+) Transcript_30669:482-859(+)
MHASHSFVKRSPRLMQVPRALFTQACLEAAPSRFLLQIRLAALPQQRRTHLCATNLRLRLADLLLPLRTFPQHMQPGRCVCTEQHLCRHGGPVTLSLSHRERRPRDGRAPALSTQALSIEDEDKW